MGGHTHLSVDSMALEPNVCFKNVIKLESKPDTAVNMNRNTSK